MGRSKETKDIPSQFNELYARSIMNAIVAGALTLDAIDKGRANELLTNAIDSQVAMLPSQIGITEPSSIATLFVFHKLPNTITFNSIYKEDRPRPTFDSVSLNDIERIFSGPKQPCVFVTINPKTNHGYVITGVSEESVDYFDIDNPDEVLQGSPGKIPEEFGPFVTNGKIKAALITKKSEETKKPT